MRVTVPAAGEGISTVVLSVCTSTSGSSSAISCPSETSQRAISPSVSPSPRSGSLNSYATSDSYRIVREDRMDTFDAVHNLRHTQVDDNARESVCVAALEAVLALHQVEHAGDRQR